MPTLTEEEKKNSAFNKVVDAVEEFQKSNVPDLSEVVNWDNTITIGGKEFVRIGKHSLIACDAIEQLYIVKGKKDNYDCLVVFTDKEEQRVSIS